MAQSCLERAAGNPLFLEQLLRSVQEGTEEGLPDSIQSLVLARMDRLKPEDKRALQAASVIGQRFDGEALYDLLETDDYDCSGLVEHNLVRPEGGGYLFTHALIQESVYGSLLKRQRKELHQKAAEWFAGSDLALHAEHLGLSGDEAAPEAFLEAAREEAEKFHIDRALELVSRGLDIVPESNSFALKYLRGDLLRHIGSVDESIDTYREAKEVATENIEHCHASLGIAEGLRLIEGYDEMLEQLDAAEVIATSQTLSAELAQIYKLRGNAHFRRGENEACLEASKRCLEHARKAGSPTLEAQSLSNLADAEQARARMVSAHDYVRRCVELCHEHGLVRILAPNLMMLGLTSFYKNEFQETLKQTRAAVELVEKTGAPKASMGILMGFAWRMSDTLWADNLTEAKNMVNQGIDIARQVGARQLVGWGQMTLARIAIQEDHRDEARNLALEVINLYRKAAVRTWEPMILGVLARATDDFDEYRSALAEGEKLIRTSTGEACFYFYRDAMAACLQREEWDEVYRYAQALEDYTYAEPLPLTDFFIAQGRALASVGRGKRDDEVMQELQHLRDEAERVGLKSVIPALEQALLSA